MILLLLLAATSTSAAPAPNVFFFFADDWGRYAGIYAEPGQPTLNDLIKTPNIDRIGREGVVFDNAFVPVSSCGPCRASLSTGRYFWNCGSHSFLNPKASDWRGTPDPYQALPKFVDILRDNAGYWVNRSRKTFSFDQSPPTPAYKAFPPVNYERYGLYVGTAADDAQRQIRHDEIIANSRAEMQRILTGRAEGKPFFFVFGSINTHRPYTADSGKKLWGIEPDSLKGRLPAFLPDVDDVRRDVSDYLGEVLALDLMLGAMLDELEKAGELDNTLVLLSGDNGIPGIPRGKTNCYDLSVRAPMMARLPGKIPAGRRVSDFVSVMDIGPTILDFAGIKPLPEMDGRSFLPQLLTDKSGWIDTNRDRVVVGRELHFYTARDGNLPYPMRAVRTKDFLYIRNFKPDRWPNGAPYNMENAGATGDYDHLDEAPWRDLDASLTKSWLLANRDTPEGKAFIDLTIGKRPPEELYSLRNDPDQMHNLAAAPESATKLNELRNELDAVLQKTHDPRLTDAFDEAPYIAPGKK